MKHYIVACRISSSSLPSGGVGDSSVLKIYSEKELAGVKASLPYLISQKKVFEFKDKDDAVLGLGKMSSIDAEIVEKIEDEKIIKEAIIEENANDEILAEEKIIEEAIIEELIIEEEANDEILVEEKIIEEAIIEEEAKAEIAEVVSTENNENINYNKKNKKK